MLKVKIIKSKSLIDFKNCPSGEFLRSCCTRKSKATIDKNNIINALIVN